jgi:hypothetical protein
MTLYSQYIYSLVLFTVNNKYLFNSKKVIHNYKTRPLNNLHLPTVSLTKYSNGAYITGVEAFNHLPQSIKMLATDSTNFKSALKRSLLLQSFNSMKEYYHKKWS